MDSRSDKPAKPATSGARRRRRRPRRSKRKIQAGPEAAVAAATEPGIDASKPAEEPLSEHEQAEMREHLRFLAKHRKVLRLKVNATEDLLINGAREPEHRGVCMHLLGKVDHACVKAALARVDDADKRTALLDGVVRFSPDIAVLLLYLEALQESKPRGEASRALSVALRKLDFGELSPAQMQRVLDLVATSFADQDLPQVVLGLLQNTGFRKTFDQAVDRLPERLAAIYLPLRAAHAVVFQGREGDPDDEALGRGIDLLLAASKKTLASHPEAARRRLFELALSRPEAAEGDSRALAALLDSFPKSSRTFSALAMLLAGRALSRHRDDTARTLLEEVRKHHAGFHLPVRWLEALDAPRFGRVAVLPAPRRRGRRRESLFRLRRGLWLDTQRPVWVCVGKPADAERFELAAKLHTSAVLPGVAPLLVTGKGPEEAPFFAVAGMGDPAATAWRKLRLDAAGARDLAVSGIEILSALALAGIVLPDALPRRFLLQGDDRLWLCNLLDAKSTTVEEARRAHLDLARLWASNLVARVAPAQLPRDLGRALETAEDLVALRACLLQATTGG